MASVRNLRDDMPAYVTVAPRKYSSKQVFGDKPGVGGMTYPPKIITGQQVPQARAVIAVPEGN